MPRTIYQTYTTETHIDVYRADFIHRGAMCAALAARHLGLAAVAAEADAIAVQIDSRKAALQQAEDDQVRARAVEEAEKLDVLDVYTEARRTMSARGYDVLTVLPGAPSALRRLGAKNFGERAAQAVANLMSLPATDPVRVAFLSKLEAELANFEVADKAEDKTRASFQGARMALTLYKSELALAREVELGEIQKILGDREKASRFTLVWRKSTKGGAAEGDPGSEQLPPAPPAP